MTDAPKQSNGKADDSFVSALNQRLSKRGTEPLGVIDVRYAEEKYFRIARWLARRHALVNHLMSRYGVEEATANSEHPFAIQQRLGEETNVFHSFFSPGAEARAATSDAPERQGVRDMRPMSLAQIIAERSASPEPPVSPENKFRISRRPPPKLPESEAAQISTRSGPDPATGQSAGDASISSAPISAPMRGFIFGESVEEDSGTEGAEVAGNTSAQDQPASPVLRSVVRNDQSGDASSIVQRKLLQRELLQREVVTNTSEQDQPASPVVRPVVRNDQSDDASSIVQRELLQREVLQREVVTNTREQEQRASPVVSPVARIEESGGASSILHRDVLQREVLQREVLQRDVLQREVVTNTSEQPASPAARNEQANTASSIARRDVATNTGAHEQPASAAARNERGGTASSIVQRKVSEIANASPVSSLPFMRPMIGRPTIRPTATPLSARPFLQPQSVGATAQAQSGEMRGQQEINSSRPSSVVPSSAAASEIRGDSSNPATPEIVWRDQRIDSRDGNLTTRESLSGSALSGGAQSSPIVFGPATQQGGPAGAAERDQMGSHELQPEHISPQVIRSISERVIRAITLDLKLERERRGVTKWR